MKGFVKEFPVLLLVLVGAFVAFRVRRRGQANGPARPRPQDRPAREPLLARLLGEAGLVAAREVRERIHGWLFRLGTLFILAGVAAAIVIPVLIKGKPHLSAGVVGGISAAQRAAAGAAGRSTGTTVELVPEQSLQSARRDLRSGRIGVAIVGSTRLVVKKPITATTTSVSAEVVHDLSAALGVDNAFAAAGITASQAARLARARPLPVTSLQPGAVSKATATSLVGLILVFVMLSQYNTWTLIGVMEEKSSRVAEVLLAAIRPGQLLAGKVLGIGLVAFAQASLIVAVAAGLAKAVGSSLLQGTAPLVLVSTLVWLVLGYAFYCWVYAAAGSMAERRDQVQSLIFPLTLPIIFGYVMAQTAVAAGSPSTFFEVLAYLPPTAPFAMPVLVGFGTVTWWEFAASALLSVVGTIGVARFAARIYRRAILRTGRRVPLREALSLPARPRTAGPARLP